MAVLEAFGIVDNYSSQQVTLERDAVCEEYTETVKATGKQ